MDNGFDEVIIALREEGKLEGTLECILGYQRINKCTFDEATDALDVSEEMIKKIKKMELLTE